MLSVSDWPNMESRQRPRSIPIGTSMEQPTSIPMGIPSFSSMVLGVGRDFTWFSRPWPRVRPDDEDLDAQTLSAKRSHIKPKCLVAAHWEL